MPLQNQFRRRITGSAGANYGRRPMNTPSPPMSGQTPGLNVGPGLAGTFSQANNGQNPVLNKMQNPELPGQSPGLNPMQGLLGTGMPNFQEQHPVGPPVNLQGGFYPSNPNESMLKKKMY